MDGPDELLPLIVSLSSTRNLLHTLLLTASDVDEILLSPMCVPRVSFAGDVCEAHIPNLFPLTTTQIGRITNDLIGNRKALLSRLQTQGSCVFSCYLDGACEFRVTAFYEGGSYTLWLRAINRSSDAKPRPRHMGDRLTPHRKACCQP
jgi:Tfp pilus assembly pilus retraction ATPase PilT